MAMSSMMPEPHPPPSSAHIRSTSSLTTDSPRPMPQHWQNDYPHLRPCFRPILRWILSILCLIATGRPTLYHAWRVLTISDEREYQETIGRVSAMVAATNISSGFLLTSVAAFITTNPPQPLYDYAQRGPYRFFLVAFSVALTSILSGSAVLVGLSMNTRNWAIGVAFASRVKIWLTLILLACPLISVLTAIIFVGIGIFVTGFSSQDNLVRALSATMLFIVSVVIVAFLAVLWKPKSTETAASHHLEPPVIQSEGPVGIA